MTMDCFARATQADHLEGRDLELKYATKGASVLTKLVKTLDGHRGQSKPNVNVGNVNVESGGQAIVSNLRSEAARPQAPEFEKPAFPSAAVLVAR